MRLATTRGMTIIVIRRMKAVPTSSRETRVCRSQPISVRLATSPTTAPATSPIRIFV